MSSDLLFVYIIYTLFMVVHVIPSIIGVYSIAKIPNK